MSERQFAGRRATFWGGFVSLSCPNSIQKSVDECWIPRCSPRIKSQAGSIGEQRLKSWLSVFAEYARCDVAIDHCIKLIGRNRGLRRRPSRLPMVCVVTHTRGYCSCCRQSFANTCSLRLIRECCRPNARASSTGLVAVTLTLRLRYSTHEKAGLLRLLAGPSPSRSAARMVGV